MTFQHDLAGMGSRVQVVIGATFIASVLLFRRGVIGELARLFKMASV